MSKTKQVSVFIKALHQHCKRKQTSIFSLKELHALAKEIHLGVDHFEAFVDTLNHQNFLLHKGNRNFQVLSSEYS